MLTRKIPGAVEWGAGEGEGWRRSWLQKEPNQQKQTRGLLASMCLTHLQGWVVGGWGLEGSPLADSIPCVLGFDHPTGAGAIRGVLWLSGCWVMGASAGFEVFSISHPKPSAANSCHVPLVLTSHKVLQQQVKQKLPSWLTHFYHGKIG